MALPPIISNLPIFKLFTKQPAAANTQAAPHAAPAREAAKDSVRISSAATRQTALSGEGEIKDEQTARQIAQATRQMLADTPESLGLDPRFAG